MKNKKVKKQLEEELNEKVSQQNEQEKFFTEDKEFKSSVRPTTPSDEMAKADEKNDLNQNDVKINLFNINLSNKNKLEELKEKVFNLNKR